MGIMSLRVICANVGCRSARFSTATSLLLALPCHKAGSWRQQQEQQAITINIALLMLNTAVRCILQLQQCVQLRIVHVLLATYQYMVGKQ